LVYSDQDKAVDFINQLSKVYRYILENRESELATLESEMNFINSYIFLLKIRFDKNINFTIEIEDTKKRWFTPPMSLQLLIENAIKHNEISEDLPLHISIKTVGEYLEVKNNLQLRINHEPSSNTGLQNIKDRYAYFTKNEIEINDDNQFFSVKIPILQSK
jgi:LytS/YehU family sensor histidine kinase